MLEEIEIDGRKAWLRPAMASRRLCVFLDAEFYLGRMGAEAELDAFPELPCVFVAHGDQFGRHRDYVCSPEFAAYLSKLPAALGFPDDGHVLCGLSLSGLQSTFTALRHPNVYPRCLAQSGSFWWDGLWLAYNVPSGAGRFWLSVGNLEDGTGDIHPPSNLHQTMSQIAGVTGVRDALVAAGHEVHYHLYEGGHEFTPWEAELQGALEWLLGP